MPSIPLTARMAAIAVSTVAFVALALPAEAAGKRYETVDYPGASATEVFAVNNLRQYVGAEREPSGAHYALLNTGSGYARIDLSSVGAVDSFAYSINGLTEVAGQYRGADGVTHGYLRHADGSIETLDYPGASGTQGYGVNDRGTVIGVFQDATGTHAFMRLKGHYLPIDIPGGTATTPLSINDSNQVVGELDNDRGAFGFVRDPSGHVSLHSAPGAPAGSSFFISINNRGGVLGGFTDANDVAQNFLRQRGRFASVGLPDSFQSQFTSAQTINDLNDIVGYYVGPDGLVHGWLGWNRNLD